MRGSPGAWQPGRIRAKLCQSDPAPRNESRHARRQDLHEEAPARRAAGGPADAATAGGAPARSVLVVDDEPNIVLSLEFLMEQAGFEVRVARDGEQALGAMREKRPDLILLDVMIPRGDGYSICKAVRANPAWRDVRIVMLTAKGRDSEREKGIALGADDYITKPFSTREVVDRVKELLGVAPG